MRITQGYVSKSVEGFHFLKSCHLTEYVDSSKPCVFFGMYRLEDFEALKQHSGIKVIRWCGQDALKVQDWTLFKSHDIFHVTPLLNVKKLLEYNGLECKIIPLENILQPEPQKLGNKIYAYCPEPKEYHGWKLIEELKQRHEIYISEPIPQSEWTGKEYEDAFIGLCLSHFAGGGYTVMELGLRGVKCVTNVVDLPNRIPFKTIDDIEVAIAFERQRIGATNRLLSKQVYDSVGFNDWLIL